MSGAARGAATIRDVALASGVSTATVSRVLSGDGPVSPGTAERVRAEVERLGYTMNRVARSLKKGSTHTVGFVGGSLEVSTARERYEGWRRAMRDSGFREEPEFTSFAGLHVESGYAAMRELRARPDPPDAWFLVNAYVHLGATNYLVSEEPPARAAEVSFAAFDEMAYAPLMRFCRWSVSQPMAEMGERAARLLLARMRGEAPPGAVELRLSKVLKKHVVRLQ